MSMPLMDTTAGALKKPAVRPHNSLKEGLSLVHNVFRGLGHDNVIAASTVSAIALSAQLLANVLVSDVDTVLDAGGHLTDYLRDWDIMNSFARAVHGYVTHPVWAIYREFVDHTVATSKDPDTTTYSDVPGFTSSVIVTGIAYAVTNIVQLRLGSTEETLDEFLLNFGSLL